MLRDITGFTKIYIACGRTDLRKGIDGLATLVKEQFRLDPFQKDVLFLFCGTRKDRFKALVWEGDGFLLSEAEELTHANWAEIQRLQDRIIQLETTLRSAGLDIPP
jgi:transposase